ncbi:MAG: SDR family oxidoreductase [Rhodothermaceae bacterium]|nr:SDR family oxidoreductase [Rhodothermaceae bacterium]MXW32295.1 SDR family oxidoreductase [Rhodothermaceae bacterium]MYC03362.1 SDR family oxidoreductase [Rhodothermaceae bacterium]MYE62004.1 SDR family oxidoreductase [Rhodothermaceae bacterium]MYI16300.1 SDR family oxidoreductase [Rhodothermaceae bacterium]
MSTPITVSILGCGYIGQPLAKLFLKRGWRVRGSTTSESKLTNLLADGIEPYLLRLTPNLEGYGRRDFFDSDVVVINFPPGRKRADVEAFMEAAMGSLLTYLKEGQVQKVLFISSTSVYSAGHVHEEDAGKLPPSSASGAALLAAEELIRNASDFKSTVLRFAGLYGYERKPGRFWSGRPLRDPQNAVNMLHRDDAVRVAMEVVKQQCWGQTFNVCADLHPTRAEFYARAASNLGLPPPQGSFGESRPNKVVLSDKVRMHLGYTFKFPDPLAPAP